MTNPLFSQDEIQRNAHEPMLEAGNALFSNCAALKSLSIVGADIIAVFRASPDITAVISKKTDNAIESACTCGFGYGSSCEHIVAAMLAANSHSAIQVGMDFGASTEKVPTPIVSPPGIQDIDIQQGPVVLSKAKADSMRQEIETICDKPTPRLYLSEWDGMLLVELRFAYLDGSVEFFSADKTREKLIISPSGQIVRLQRSLAVEMAASSKIIDANCSVFRSGTFTPINDPVVWVREDLEKLGMNGFEVFGMESMVMFKTTNSKPTMKLFVSQTGAGAEDCNISIKFGEAQAPIETVYSAVIHGKKYIKLSDGTTGEIPRDWLEKLAIVFSLCEGAPTGGSLRMRKSSLASLSLLESLVGEASWESVKEAGLKQLDEYATPQSRLLAPTFQGTLRPYQQAGYEWFYFLQEFHVGGCLADDMGLGKTVQTLALLLNEHFRGAVPKTSLLVVPTSLIFNWQRESRTFAPTLLVMNYHGPQRKRYKLSDMALAHVVITSYGTMQRDLDIFKKIQFNYIILDEAQAIKNPLSDTAKAIRELKSCHRLTLSGTPIENNLSELWSMFAFLNPGMLGSYRNFSATFIQPIEKENNNQRAQVLRKLIEPCILRRTKSQVAKELPPKTEILVNVEMTAHQRTLYTITNDACKSSVMQSIDAEGINRARMHILQALTRLRQICCHPLLVDPLYKGDSGKFEAIDDLIENVVVEKHKALVFSQFTSVLELIRKRLDGKKIPYEYLTGQTSNRQKPVDNFQSNPDIPVMLISLKAGGVGLNLTAADYVIMVDPWWNPAAENQAADRAYRIGQTKPVFVYKLITTDSVEQRVVEFQKSKQELFDAIITAEPSIFKNLEKADIARLFE